ncbi:hypothetical protein [Falsiroseomonas sp. HW251]|uniref:hypothetical protein n=1 Tax=Falsiroseomonas sp. HW251 TaxID=3390998 RepID=UPI003D31322C
MSGTKDGDGVVKIEAGSPLTRLHFFDGKYLRADALTQEQDYHREALRLSNLAGGWGVVHGLGLGQVGGALAVSPGHAIMPTGRVALLTQGMEVAIADLIAAAQSAQEAGGKGVFGDCVPAAATAADTAGQGIYEVTVGPAQALCGSEEVFGRLCADACVTDTERPYWREGLVLRLRPVTLTLPTSSAVPFGAAHLRSRVASAYFAEEPGIPGALLSAQGLASSIWCGPASLYTRDEVPIGLLVREGSTIRVLDAWSARRERMEPQARSYWQGRMRMRPWNVFLAQILQFQCQLSGLFQKGSPVFTPQADDDCAKLRALLADSLKDLEAARAGYAEGNRRILKMVGAEKSAEGAEAAGPLATAFKRIEALAKRLGDAQDSLGTATPNRMLLAGGFVQLPPAGYLPVIAGQLPVNAQIRRMMGEGVALTFCAVPLDHLGHLLEEAQHMDRISLTRGLDDPSRREEVEIFVPDGQVVGAAGGAGGIQWSARMLSGLVENLARAGIAGAPAPRDGTTAEETLAGATAELKDTLAGAVAKRRLGTIGSFQRQRVNLVGVGRSRIVGADGGLLVVLMHTDPDAKQDGKRRIDETSWLELRIDGDPFAGTPGDEIPARVEQRRLRVATAGDETESEADILAGEGRITLVTGPFPVGPGETGIRVVLAAQATLQRTGSDAPPEPAALRFDLTLSRRGDAADGRLRMRLHRRDSTAGDEALVASWSGAPRHATLTAEDDDDIPVELTEIPALAPESPARLQALDALQKLGDATEDEAFAAAARRKLFADAANPAGQALLNATRDFVLFRRRRQGCQGAAAAAPVTERFVVLHAKLPDEGAAKALQAALAGNDAGALAKFDIARVQVLRYADAAQMPEESRAEILRAWQQASPGPRALLGRVWETAPTTGQGWQNRARLQRLTEMLEGLVAPPATGELAAIAAPPAGLGDPAFDGGMLIATVADAKASQRVHRVFVVETGLRSRVRDDLKKTGGTEAWLARTSKLGTAVTVRLDAAGTPNADDMKLVRNAANGAFMGDGHLALASTASGAAAVALADHRQVCKQLGTAPAPQVSATKVASFGDGAIGASILFFAAIN